MLHLCIAKKVAKEMNFSINYIKGSILPDLTKRLEGKDRKMTHYITEHTDGILEVPNLEKFTYENKLNNEETLGIYSHLIEDKIYFEKFVSNYIEVINEDKIRFKYDNKIRNFEGYQKIFYSDFLRLNYYLIKHYNLNIEKLKNDLLEITQDNNLKQYIEESIKEYDFEAYEPIVFDEKEADRYVEMCYQKVVEEMKNKV